MAPPTLALERVRILNSLAIVGVGTGGGCIFSDTGSSTGASFFVNWFIASLRFDSFSGLLALLIGVRVGSI